MKLAQLIIINCREKLAFDHMQVVVSIVYYDIPSSNVFKQLTTTYRTECFYEVPKREITFV